MASQHSVSFLDGIGQPFTTRQTDTPTELGPDELLIKTAALAINPADWQLQDAGGHIHKWPTVLGEDVAGTVSKVGSSVTRFKPGDRIIGHVLFLTDQQLKYGGFQEYVVMKDHAIALLPANISFEAGCVLPLAISTAAAALHQKASDGGLELPLPTASPASSGKAILIWGGSSSVGSVGIQLAKASGVKVVTTASSRNLEYVKKLGADAAVDYNAPGVVGDVITALQKLGDFAGVYDGISTPETLQQSAQIAVQFGGGRIASVQPPKGEFVSNVTAKLVIAPYIFFNEVGKPVWQDWVPGALESGQLVPAPDALVVGHGLDCIQKAVRKNKDGVSAQKVVVTV